MAQIIRGNALALPLAADSVDLVVTSPPYFGLRSYQDGGEHYDGQIGAEATPAEFVDALIAATREMVRVVKPSGSIWVNLGDKYSANWTSARGNGGAGLRDEGRGRERHTIGANGQNMRPKSLIGIPWRYALRCIDDLGLILRAEVIWSKPNGLPESVTDRVRRSHEQWFHFTLNPRYYSAVDEVREEYAPGTADRYAYGMKPAAVAATKTTQNGPLRRDDAGPAGTNPLGKLPGSVWTIPQDGESLTRTVLSAVSDGKITVEEGERILWSASSGSWSASQWSSPAVGNGSSTATHADTPRSQSATGARNSSTESPTSSTSDPSLKGSRSTTSAATPVASTLTTSSPSPSARTSDAPTLSAPTADTGTPWQTPTSTGPLQDSPTRSAGRASSPGSDAGESVWVVPTEPLRVPEHLGIDHFAAYPTEFPRRIITGWSPRGVCVECGAGRRPVATRSAEYEALRNSAGDWNAPLYVPGQGYDGSGNRRPTSFRPSAEVSITGEACDCDPKACRVCGLPSVPYCEGFRCCDSCTHNTLPPTTPGVVLDPFGGTGTTALVADALGRHGISVDMSRDYCRLAEWRTTDPKQRAKAARREFTPPREQVDGQLAIFEEMGA